MRQVRFSSSTRNYSAWLLCLLTGGALVAGSTACTELPGAGRDEVVGETTAAVYTIPTTDRAKIQLNGTWKFTASNSLTGAEVTGYNDSGWSSVAVPHTWDNPASVQNANAIADYSNSWYRTHFTIDSTDAAKRIFMQFEGAFQIADVYVNGQWLGQHRGGYTAFSFDATSAINFGGDNVLAVKVSNKDCPDCLPSGNANLFKGYGGIYRKAWILKTNKYQVSATDYGSNGVYVTQSNVSATNANISIRTVVKNNDTVSQTFTVKNWLTDSGENNVITDVQSVVVAAGATVSVTQTGTVPNPHLWSPASPYLYNVHASVAVGGTTVDTVNDKVGLRYYSLTSTDFKLNGVSTKLRGVAKHQETEYSATAVSDADLTTDWDNLQDLGVNYVRLVHYPHAQLEYTLADQRGIMVWAENGQTNGGNGGVASANSDNLTREMVYQNFNHPSIIFWSVGNEAGGGEAATSEYATVVKAADTSRPVTYASNGQNPSNIDFIFQNTYDGWYGGPMYDWNTSNNHWISESGAGMALGDQNPDNFNMSYTVNSYEPEQYGDMVMEVKFQDMFVTNPSHVPVFSAWAFREISDLKYKGYINSKGLLTYSNYKKDAYYLYQSFLKTTPVVRICGAHYFLRDADPAGQGDVKVYSNSSSLTLTVNGVSMGSVGNGNYHHPNGEMINNVFYWNNVLSIGRNTIVASDGTNSHVATIYYRGAAGSMPNEAGAKVANVTSSNMPAYFINKAPSDQRPFYRDFDGTGSNTFDVIPSELSGAVGWIATKRQSDPVETENVAFDLTQAASVYIMFTKQSSVPSWISSAGFADTGVTGKWRDNNMVLQPYQLYKKTFAGSAHVSLGSSSIDYVIIIK